jgi:hypothetical protein
LKAAGNLPLMLPFDTFDMTASSIGVYVVCRGQILLGTVNRSKTMTMINHW